MPKLKINKQRKLASQILTILMFLVVFSMVVALFAPGILTNPGK